MTLMLTCTHLTKDYPSGKSTLLHLLGGLDRPTSGSLRLEDIEYGGLSDRELTLLRRRKIGFVFQAFNLIPTLSAEENILLPLLLDGRKENRALLHQLLGELGLRERADIAGEMQAFKAILYIALFASALGIINTLALSVVEQRRELALLRAVGATAGQTGFMIVAESLFLGLVGVALGVLAGSLFAASFVRGAELYMNFAAPFTYPAADAVRASILALAILAAAVPAWRAGGVQPVTGLRTE